MRINFDQQRQTEHKTTKHECNCLRCKINANLALEKF